MHEKTYLNTVNWTAVFSTHNSKRQSACSFYSINLKLGWSAVIYKLTLLFSQRFVFYIVVVNILVGLLQYKQIDEKTLI